MIPGYIYAASLTLVILTLILVYNFKEETRILWTKALIALPFVVFIVYSISKIKAGEENIINTSDLVLSIIITCLSLFITGIGSMLILSRTKGGKVND